MIRSAYYGYTEITKKLLHAKADPNVKNLQEVTALMWAAQRGHKDIVELLLDSGADSDIKDSNGYTLLFRAKYLLYQGDDIAELIKNHRKD